MNEQKYENTFEDYEKLVDKRHQEVLYNGCFTATDDPMDFIDRKEAERYAQV